MKICFVLGTRPEIIKLYSLIKLCKTKKIKHFIIHTGQHNTYLMDKKFFEDFGIVPDYLLKSNKEFLTTTIQKLSKIYLKEKPNYIINQGDTNTVLASSIACNKLNYRKDKNKNRFKLVHVEAGLRSYDRSMPEEINRIVADQLADILLAPTEISKKNLLKENHQESKIFVVGNTICDSIKDNKKKLITKFWINLNLLKKNIFY